MEDRIRAFAAHGAVDRPIPVLADDRAHLGHFDRFHHLADGPVRDEHADRAVFLRQVEGENHQVDRLLNGSRSEHDGVIVPMPAAVDSLVVIRLRGGDVAESRSAAHHVDQHHGDFRPCDVGDAFHHQRYTGAGGSAHHPCAGAGGAVHHVDGGNFRFGLDEGASQLGHAFGKMFQDFSLWGDGVAEVGFQPGADGGFRHGLIAFIEFF